MKPSTSKLSLRKDTIRVLSQSEMNVVVGGLAFSPAQAGINTLSIHCSSACAMRYSPGGTIAR
jgi:hypothetical protein